MASQCFYIYPRGTKRMQRCEREVTTSEGFCDLCFEKVHPKEGRKIIDCLNFDFIVNAADEDDGTIIYEEPKHNIAIIFDQRNIPRAIGWFDENRNIQRLNEEHLKYCKIFGIPEENM